MIDLRDLPAPVIQKVVAYITCGEKLLVFRHRDFPAAGIQVPAGTLKPGESPVEGARREAREEAGIDDLRVARSLGSCRRDMRPLLNQVHHRHVFHLGCDRELPDEWLHWERSDGLTVPIAFRFFWIPLDGAERYVVGGQGDLLWKLRRESGSNPA